MDILVNSVALLSPRQLAGSKEALKSLFSLIALCMKDEDLTVPSFYSVLEERAETVLLTNPWANFLITCEVEFNSIRKHFIFDEMWACELDSATSTYIESTKTLDRDQLKSRIRWLCYQLAEKVTWK